MNLQLKNFLDNLQGTWKTKKTIYLIKYNIERKYKEKFNIIKNNYTNHLYTYKVKYHSLQKSSNISINKILVKDYLVNKLYNNFKQEYFIKVIQQNIIHFEYTLKKQFSIYSEYIYIINNNLTISIGFLKVNNKYEMIVFTSYIKINNNNK